MTVREGARFAALALLVGIAALALMGCAAPADPQQVAEAHVAAEVDAVIEDIAAWIVEQDPLTRAVGMEGVTAGIKSSSVEWRYEPAIDTGGGRAAIRAYADLAFGVSNPLGGRASVISTMPYDFVVDTRGGSVVSMDAVYAAAFLGFGGDHEYPADDNAK